MSFSFGIALVWIILILCFLVGGWWTDKHDNYSENHQKVDGMNLVLLIIAISTIVIFVTSWT
ncbi:MAG: hypothetical protein HOL23_04880 [Gammaproteobacteria bacterium]|jgi:hypothetical protein|nr:hypothetical protein [Gammaproteobacteria bacterium]